jgi:predicted RNA methylase
MKQTRKASLFERIDLGIRRGVATALAEHKKAGRSIAISKNGKIVEVPARNIRVPKV